jgi:peptide subunit release factor 1 (eRF1)
VTDLNGRGRRLERAELERRVRDVLARASVVAEAPGTSFIPSGHSQHGPREPTTARGGHLVDQVQRKLASCRTTPELIDALDEAEQRIKDLRQTPPKPKRSFKQVILEDEEGQHYKEVGVRYNTPPTTIRQWRQDAGREPLDGTRRDLGGPHGS